MKLFLLTILIIFLTGCAQRENSRQTQSRIDKSAIRNLKLVDSLGNISFLLPLRYDTTYIWTNYSDCGKPCNKVEYGFQPKNLRIYRESGWIWIGNPQDSIERFVISHSGYFPFHNNSDSNLIFLTHTHKKLNILSDPAAYRINSDNIEKIGDRFFSIIVIDIYDSIKHQFLKKLLASTSIKGNIIDFNYELLTKKNDSLTKKFIDNSNLYLHSIKINNSR